MRGALHSKRYAKFRERLKAARLEANLTQTAAAERLDKPQSFIQKSESGERRVDVIELEDFAKLYKKRIGYFFGKA